MKLLRYIICIPMILILLCCEEGGLLIVPDISSRTVTIIAPANGTEVSSNIVFFDWEIVEDATTYEIQIASPNFENIAQLLLNTEDSLTFAEVQLPVGEYQWRVKAKNSEYETSYSMASFKVVPVENFSDNTVILNSPGDNLVSNMTSHSLQWQPIEGATLYRVQILQNGSITQEQTTTGVSLDITFTEGESTWQVRAENGLDNTLYSSRNILIDTISPNTPQLTAPMDGEELTSGDVSFEWNRELLEGSVEFDSIYIYRDTNLTDLVLKEEVTSPYSTTLTNDTYYWLVKGFDQAGNQGTASPSYSFIVNE